jgi:hypothetical protein
MHKIWMGLSNNRKGFVESEHDVAGANDRDGEHV